MVMIDFDLKIKQAKEKQQRHKEKIKRHIELGYINGKILQNGSVLVTKPKGIQQFYNTRTLINLVNQRFNINDNKCYINKKWQLQIRGKHLRRLLKAMPNVRYDGSKLYKISNN
jgi:virulence-associated protein VapD